jgi:nucleoside-diphosphate-sugar epimerase
MQANHCKHIVVTGANGFIGSNIVRHFLELNYRVTALVRNIPKQKINNVEYVMYDLTNNSALPCFTKHSILVHTAYIKQKQSDIEDYNITGTKHLLQLAKSKGVKQCIFISSISVLSNSNTYYAIQKREIEKLFNTNEGCILRPGLVIGNGGLFYKSLLQLKKRKMLPLINKGLQPIYYVGINDVVNVIETIVIKDIKGVINLVNPTQISFKEFYKQIANQLDFKIFPIPVPLWLLQCVVWFFSFSKNPLITKDNLIGLIQINDINIASDTTFKTSALTELINDVAI